MLLCSAAGLWPSVLFRTSSRISQIPRRSSSSTSKRSRLIFRCTVWQWKTDIVFGVFAIFFRLEITKL
uniref:Uncharacterized protein n=1 Tax=Brassica campestris TaxID=3711 RepID=A0A3P6BJM8_BRACM|nr:unnamed protein product [Brassica rapa]